VGDSGECVLDTSVLQKANAPLDNTPRSRSQFAKRLELLKSCRSGALVVLVSPKLIGEYRKQVKEPRNEYVRAFFAIVSEQKQCIFNYTRWPGACRAKARKCRYPKHDDHVLRTAIRDHPTTIYCEENPMLQSDRCIYREFRVRITNPVA